MRIFLWFKAFLGVFGGFLGLFPVLALKCYIVVFNFFSIVVLCLFLVFVSYAFSVILWGFL